MFLAPLLTTLRGAFIRTFDADYAEADFRNLHISLEFPIKAAQYPAIWVDFEPVGSLETVGIAHLEFGEEGEQGNRRPFTRWRFGGHATFTVVALSSLERARLYDEVVRIVAFGGEAPQTRAFRTYVEDNPHLAINMSFDRLTPRGVGHSQGTPWGTSETIYEATLAGEVVGELVNDPVTASLVPLSAIKVHPYHDREQDPSTIPGNPLAPAESWQ